MNNWIKMPDPDRIETKNEASEEDKVIFDTREDLTELADKIQIEAIVEDLNIFINPLDLDKKSDLVDYILGWKLWSNERMELESMVRYIIYWMYSWNTVTSQPFSYRPPQSSVQSYTQKDRFSWEKETPGYLENKFARKIKYILDNYWKDIKTLLSEIKAKEAEMKAKAVSRPAPIQNHDNPATQKEEWIFEWAVGWLKQWIKDIYNYWTEKLSDLWNITTNIVPSWLKRWVKDNLFAPEKQKNTEITNEIYQRLQWPEKPDFLPFYLAIQWYNKEKGSLWNTKYLTVVDYSKPVSQNRLYVINMDTLTVENCVRTGHGRNSGNTQTTTRFSNNPNSNQTSIGFFRTPDKRTPNSRYVKTRWREGWMGLFLNWTEYSNNNARQRWIAVHAVWEFFYGRNWKGHRAGESTSEWCITIRSKDNPVEIMDKIKWDSLIYSYYPDVTYFNRSELIR